MNEGATPRPTVWKFGGSSVRDAERILHVAGLVAGSQGRGGPGLRSEGPLVVVVSAMADTTDHLVALSPSAAPPAAGPDAEPAAALQRILDHHLGVLDAVAPADHTSRAALLARTTTVRDHLLALPASPGAWSPETQDTVRALGEDLSALLLTAALVRVGVDAVHVDARDLIRTDATFGEGRPAEVQIRDAAVERLLPPLARGQVLVVQGFVGATEDGRTTTLGRGGSDLTATLIGAAIQAAAVHIWTDVEGIMTGDPRYVDTPRVLDVLGFEEAVELAYFGAGVLHAGAAKQAVARGVPVRIRSTFAPHMPGTLILEARWGGPEIAAVAHKTNVTLIKVRSRPEALPYGFLARVFDIMNRYTLPVDLVATSHTSTAFTLDGAERIDQVARALEAIADVEVRTRLATVTVVGRGLLREPGFDARVFRTVGSTPVHLISQASDVSLSFVVDGPDAAPLVRRLHRELVEARDSTRDATLDAPVPSPKADAS